MRLTWFIALGLLAAGLLAGTASALPADKHVTLEADNGESCVSEQKVNCFRVAEGNLTGFEQGMAVHIQLQNVGSSPHNVFAADGADADQNHVDTPESAAINGSDTIEGNESTNLTFTIPTDAESLYLWCDVGNHEMGGMWLSAEVSEASATNGSQDDGDGANDTQTPGGDADDENAMPAPSALVAVGVVGAAALVRRRAR